MNLDIEKYPYREDIYVMTIKSNMNLSVFNKSLHDIFTNRYITFLNENPELELLILEPGIDNFNIDSAGLGKIIALTNAVRERGAEISLSKINGKLDRLVTQLQWPKGFFKKYNSAKEAVAAYDTSKQR